MSFSDLASQILTKLKDIAQTETIIGKPIQIENTTLIPVSKVTVGFGMGGANKAGKDEAGGSGGGLSVEPIAFVVITDGFVKIMPMAQSKDVMGKVIDLLPDALALLKKEVKNKKEEE